MRIGDGLVATVAIASALAVAGWLGTRPAQAIPVPQAVQYGPELPRPRALHPEPLETLPAIVFDAHALSPDHRRLALATKHYGVWIIDVASRRIVSMVAEDGAEAESLAWSPDGHDLAILLADASVWIVESETGLIRRAISRWTGRGRRIAYAADGDVIVVSMHGPCAELFAAADASPIATCTTRPDHAISAMTLSRDRRWIALGDEDGRVGVWDVRTGKRIGGELQLQDAPRRRSIMNLDFDPRGQTLAVASWGCIARLWDFESASRVREISTCESQMFPRTPLFAVRFSSDGAHLLASIVANWEATLVGDKAGDLSVRVDDRNGTKTRVTSWSTWACEYYVADLRSEPSASSVQAAPASTSEVPIGWPGSLAVPYTAFASDSFCRIEDGHFVVREPLESTPLLRIPLQRN